MRKLPIKRLIYGVMAFWLVMSCDTKNDFIDPSKNYFLKYYGKEGIHFGVDVVALGDSAFFILGTSRVAVSENSAVRDLGKQIYLAKVNSVGTVLWEKNFGTTRDEEARDLELMANGNLALVANVSVNATNRDVILMTLDQRGTRIDSIAFGVEPGIDDDAISVTEFSDGFMVCGSKGVTSPAGDTRDAIQVRFTRSLAPYPSWREIYSQGTFDAAIKAFQISPTSNLVFGYTNGATANDPNRTINYWVYGLNELGEPQGQNKIGSALDNEVLGSVISSPNTLGQGYLLSGISIAPNNNQNVYLIKHDIDPQFTINDIQFERKFNDDLGVAPNSVLNYDRVFAAPAANSGFLILATRLMSDGNTDLQLSKVDSRGQNLWSVTLGGETFDSASAVTELPDGKILVLGTIKVGGTNGQEKIALLKLNANGRLSD